MALLYMMASLFGLTTGNSLFNNLLNLPGAKEGCRIPSMEIELHPIGVIHSPFNDKGQTPIQPSRSDAVGTVEVLPEYVEGLKDLDGFSHIMLFYVFHKSSGYSLTVTPFLDTQPRGLFATRYPARPNPIGFSIVHLLKIEGNLIEVDGIDVLDGTPLLDIKPYVPEFDVRANARAGWLDR